MKKDKTVPGDSVPEQTLRLSILQNQRRQILFVLTGSQFARIPLDTSDETPAPVWHERCVASWNAIVRSHEWAVIDASEPRWEDFEQTAKAKKSKKSKKPKRKNPVDERLVRLVDDLTSLALTLLNYPEDDPFLREQDTSIAGIEATSAHKVCAIATGRVLTLLNAVAVYGFIPAVMSPLESPGSGLIGAVHATSDSQLLLPDFTDTNPADRAVLLLRSLFSRTRGLSVDTGSPFALRAARNEDKRMQTQLSVEMKQYSLIQDERASLVTCRLTDGERAILAVLHETNGRLIGKAIADKACLSVNTVRELFAKLIRHGLVDNQPRKGYVITRKGRVALNRDV